MDSIHTLVNPVRIKVIGVGGGGGNAVNRMIEAGLIDPNEVEFISMNTDLQALRNSKAYITIQLGAKTTKGQGSGGNPEVGRKAAEESIEIIKELLVNTDMLFLTCGMGKGTGTGATPLISKLAKDAGILTVGIVTKPFSFEGQERIRNAEMGISELKKYVDALLVIPNDKFFELYPSFSFEDVLYKIADDVLYKAVLSIWNVITRPGYVNVDFADAKNVLKDAGDILMGVGVVTDETENKVKKAIKLALNNPFFENLSISGAKKLLINICGKNIVAHDVKVAGEYISHISGRDITTFVGYVSDPSFQDKVEVTVIASGFSTKPKQVTRKDLFQEKFINETSHFDTTKKTLFPSIRKGLRVLK